MYLSHQVRGGAFIGSTVQHLVVGPKVMVRNWTPTGANRLFRTQWKQVRLNSGLEFHGPTGTRGNDSPREVSDGETLEET